MPGLSLDDLDIDFEEPTKPARPEPGRAVVGTVTIRDAALAATHYPLQDTIRDLGVGQAAQCLSEATHQIWGNRPDLMPSSAILMAARGETHVEWLDSVLRLVLPARTAERILELTRRRAHRWLTDHPSWQARLADEGADYPEMERRSLHGEFDLSGPLDSLFDLRTMTFREA